MFIAIALLVAAPSSAGAGDTAPGGCRAAGQYTAELARELGPAFGELSSELAALDLRDEFASGLHATLCDAQP
jgi:hypothetical protein